MMVKKCYKVSWQSGRRRIRSAATFSSKSKALKNLRRARKNKESILHNPKAKPRVVQTKC